MISAQKSIFIIFFVLASGLFNGPNDLDDYVEGGDLMRRLACGAALALGC
jgi:hypothetical protein